MLTGGLAFAGTFLPARELARPVLLEDERLPGQSPWPSQPSREGPRHESEVLLGHLAQPSHLRPEELPD